MRGQLDELDVRPLVSLLMPPQTITEAQKRMKECKKIERVTLPLPEESRSSPPVQLDRTPLLEKESKGLQFISPNINRPPLVTLTLCNISTFDGMINCSRNGINGLSRK